MTKPIDFHTEMTIFELVPLIVKRSLVLQKVNNSKNPAKPKVQGKLAYEVTNIMARRLMVSHKFRLKDELTIQEKDATPQTKTMREWILLEPILIAELLKKGELPLSGGESRLFELDKASHELLMGQLKLRYPEHYQDYQQRKVEHVAVQNTRKYLKAKGISGRVLGVKKPKV